MTIAKLKKSVNELAALMDSLIREQQELRIEIDKYRDEVAKIKQTLSYQLKPDEWVQRVREEIKHLREGS